MTDQNFKPIDKAIHLVLIEDDDDLRTGYEYLFNLVEKIKVIGTYPSVELLEKNISNQIPDIILLDLSLKGISGIPAIKLIKKLLPESKILILTGNIKDDLLFQALAAGVNGYITKDIIPGRIIQAIQDIVNGGTVLSAAVTTTVIQAFQKNTDSPLTHREEQVLQLVANGKSRSRIAKELFVTMETVKTHLKNIYLKLHVHTREEAITIAKQNKWIK